MQSGKRMVTTEIIIDFLKKEIGSDVINADSDLLSDLGVYGDDFHEVIEAFAKKFDVEMDNYLWYFHTPEEGNSGFGGWFFTPPNERVKRIPVTPAILTEFANKGKWDIKYPEHKIPKRRWDLLINTILFVILLLWIVIVLIIKYFD